MPSGHAHLSWQAPLTGVAVFFDQFPANVTSVQGIDVERAAGQWYARVVQDASYQIEVTSTPSSPCQVGYAVDSVPANDDVADAELLSGSSGEH